jgi:hypothetical protein
MPEAGSTFTDWQQVERDSLLFVDDDFDWSEPPQRGRRRITGGTTSARRSAADEPIYAERRASVLEYEPESLDGYGSRFADQEPYAESLEAERAGAWDHPTAVHSHFDEMMEEWNAAYGDGADGLDDRTERAFDLSDPGHQAGPQGARRTVLITGRGDDRYLPAPRQRRPSELRFHERSGFSPDRAGLWAVLLGIALVIGCIAH